MTNETTSKQWDRQTNETNKAYAAFCVYRDLGVRRSLSKTVKKIFPDISLDKYTTKIRGLAVWSSKYTWVKRVELWDAFQESEFRKDMTIARKEMAGRQVAYGRAMQVKGITRIKDMLPDELNPDQANRLIDTGVKIERAAMGEPDKVEVEHTGEITQNMSISLETMLKEYDRAVKKIEGDEKSS